MKYSVYDITGEFLAEFDNYGGIYEVGEDLDIDHPFDEEAANSGAFILVTIVDIIDDSILIVIYNDPTRALAARDRALTTVLDRLPPSVAPHCLKDQPQDTGTILNGILADYSRLIYAERNERYKTPSAEDFCLARLVFYKINDIYKTIQDVVGNDDGGPASIYCQSNGGEELEEQVLDYFTGYYEYEVREAKAAKEERERLTAEQREIERLKAQVIDLKRTFIPEASEMTDDELLEG